MNWPLIATCILVAVIFVYLIAALLHPENFS